MDQETASNGKIVDLIQHLARQAIRLGKPASIITSMIIAITVTLTAAHYMPYMRSMGESGWRTTHYAIQNYQTIHWTCDTAKITGIGILKFACGWIAYLALLVPALLSLRTFLTGGVRLIKLIAGR